MRLVIYIVREAKSWENKRIFSNLL